MKTKPEKPATSPVRVNDNLMQELREMLEPLGAESDAQALRWACETFLALVKDENKPPAIPPVAAIARGYHRNGLPVTSGK
tara:strand:+ start:459 stop:701 length:243 start_codon:yes stop_codon:yes gene_type:complete